MDKQSKQDIAELAGDGLPPVADMFQAWFPQISGAFRSIQGGNVRIVLELDAIANDLQSLYRLYQVAESQAGGPLVITIAVMDKANEQITP